MPHSRLSKIIVVNFRSSRLPDALVWVKACRRMTSLEADPQELTPPAASRNAWVRVWIGLRIVALGLSTVLAGLMVFDTIANPVSTLMLARRLTGQKVERIAVPLEKISPWLTLAVIASEDARFCLHSGVDWQALRSVATQVHNGGPARGASTIDMQTVKNLFLFPGRSVFRKALEIPLTLTLNIVWSKPRILGAYLNVAEWGDGVFGAEAAARSYFHKSAAGLTPREAALLAAALPNPLKRDPHHPGFAYARLSGKVMARMASGAVPTGCVSGNRP
jgi:monofunctional biosynthetic peptidoglycan transglycosylase